MQCHYPESNKSQFPSSAKSHLVLIGTYWFAIHWSCSEKSRAFCAHSVLHACFVVSILSFRLVTSLNGGVPSIGVIRHHRRADRGLASHSNTPCSQRGAQAQYFSQQSRLPQTRWPSCRWHVVGWLLCLLALLCENVWKLSPSPVDTSQKLRPEVPAAFCQTATSWPWEILTDLTQYQAVVKVFNKGQLLESEMETKCWMVIFLTNSSKWQI